jgi:hypothetical protein
LDIETVPEVADFNDLDADMQVLYEQKSNTSVKTISQLRFYDRAGIWAELEKLFVYLLAILSLKGDVRNFRVTSLAKSLSF